MDCLDVGQGEAGDHCGVEPTQARPWGPGAQTYLYLFLIRRSEICSKYVNK